MSALDDLLDCMARLRHPERGCPWDRDQTFATIAPYTLEEAYEVADAIAREDWQGLKGELGDLLFQVVFYAQMARENDWFDFQDIAAAMVDKLTRRHPHVFGEGHYESHAQLHRQWEALKAEERAARASKISEPGNQPASRLDDVPLALPALTRAQKLQKRAASVGFDWPALAPVRARMEEELRELDAAIASGDADAVRDEMGDVLFTAVNLARHLQQDAESSLRAANEKFSSRFRRVEQLAAAQGRTLAECSDAELDAWWQTAKRAE